MLWVVRITAVFPLLVDKRDITSHMNLLAMGSIPKISWHNKHGASQVKSKGLHKNICIIIFLRTECEGIEMKGS